MRRDVREECAVTGGENGACDICEQAGRETRLVGRGELAAKDEDETVTTRHRHSLVRRARRWHHAAGHLAPLSLFGQVPEELVKEEVALAVIVLAAEEEELVLMRMRRPRAVAARRWRGRRLLLDRRLGRVERRKLFEHLRAYGRRVSKACEKKKKKRRRGEWIACEREGACRRRHARRRGLTFSRSSSSFLLASRFDCLLCAFSVFSAVFTAPWPRLDGKRKSVCMQPRAPRVVC